MRERSVPPPRACFFDCAIVAQAPPAEPDVGYAPKSCSGALSPSLEAAHFNSAFIFAIWFSSRLHFARYRSASAGRLLCYGEQSNHEQNEHQDFHSGARYAYRSRTHRIAYQLHPVLNVPLPQCPLFLGHYILLHIHHRLNPEAVAVSRLPPYRADIKKSKEGRTSGFPSRLSRHQEQRSLMATCRFSLDP